MGCVARHEGFSQVFVWLGKTVGADRIDEFVESMRKNFGIRVQYLEEIIVARPVGKYAPACPDMPATRTDLFFAVHEEDLHEEFRMHRLRNGIMWVEAVATSYNKNRHMYPEWIMDYRSY